jgi:hypothetical protein
MIDKGRIVTGSYESAGIGLTEVMGGGASATRTLWIPRDPATRDIENREAIASTQSVAGSIERCPSSATCSVHLSPSQYRSWWRPEGSGAHRAGG